MSDNESSLETRASSAYVQGQLAELVKAHSDCDECSCAGDLFDVLKEWKQAQAELKASKESK